MKPTVGLTGGIASGKSTVARMFGELGIPIVDADQLARDVVAVGTPGLKKITEAFGTDYLTEDGTLDRAKMGSLVFGDEDARKRLNAIVHPLIAQAGMQALQSLADHPAPYRIYEAALLVENKIHRMFPTLIVVAVDPSTQLTRLMERDGFSREEAEARIASQMPLEEKTAVADHVIDNGGSPEETRAQVEAIHQTLRGDA
ncbi:MAG: dephospho-CoA kinase [Myxococcota bacterium]